MSKKGWPPSHRNPELPQPEICQLTGSLTHSRDLIVADVEGLRGAHIGSTYPWSAQARVRPSWNDLRRLNPGPPLESSQQKGLSGGSLWFRGGEGVTDVFIVPGPDGDLIEVASPPSPLVNISTEDNVLITTESGNLISIG